MTTMPLDKVQEQHDAMPGVSMVDYVVGAAMRQGIRVPPADSFDGDVAAELYRGLWIARCPECSNACTITSINPIYFCPDCGAGWFHVVFPTNKHAIVAEVSKRPNIRGRLVFANWKPFGGRTATGKPTSKPETLKQLQRETKVLIGLALVKDRQ